MEEKKLLRILTFLIFSPLLARMDLTQVIQELQEIHPSTEDLKRACSLKEKTDDFIKERRAALLHETPQETDFFVFVSTSMHPDHLLEIGKEAQRYGGVLVLRGLVQDSFKETLKELSFLFKKEVGVLIDPQLFEDHNVQQVPTFVLTDGTRWDRMIGSVSPKYALESFAERGDLSREAQRRLNK